MASNPTKMEPDAPASPRATVLKIGKANALALVSALDPPENQPKQIKTWPSRLPRQTSAPAESAPGEEEPGPGHELAPPHAPHDDDIAGDDPENNLNDIESQLDSISVADVSPTTKKRSREENSNDEDDWDKRQRIIDNHQESSRKEATLKEQRLKLDAKLVMVVARKTEAEDELRRTVKAISKEELREYFVRGQGN